MFVVPYIGLVVKSLLVRVSTVCLLRRHLDKLTPALLLLEGNSLSFWRCWR